MVAALSPPSVPAALVSGCSHFCAAYTHHIHMLCAPQRWDAISHLLTRSTTPRVWCSFLLLAVLCVRLLMVCWRDPAAVAAAATLMLLACARHSACVCECVLGANLSNDLCNDWLGPEHNITHMCGARLCGDGHRVRTCGIGVCVSVCPCARAWFAFAGCGSAHSTTDTRTHHTCERIILEWVVHVQGRC